MTAQKKAARPKAKAATRVPTALKGLAKKIDETGKARAGHVVFTLSGDAGGVYCLECDGRQTALSRSAVPSGDRATLVEVIGDADVVADILAGKKDAVKTFFAGGLRIRGDIRYLSDMAVELGILKDPL